MLAPPLVLRREISLPIEGDLRAWDGLPESGRDRAALRAGRVPPAGGILVL